MPKIKTRRSAAKRFKLTGTGKVVRGKIGGRHLLEWKTSAKKRSLKQRPVLSSANIKAVHRMLPGV